jgi:hypothetical protein
VPSRTFPCPSTLVILRQAKQYHVIAGKGLFVS